MVQQPLLSILIPTVVGREDQFSRLLKRVANQCINDATLTGIECGFADKYSIYKIGTEMEVEIVWAKDDKELTIGEKRELMYQESDGLFSWQIDDDDDISENAIELIINAIKSNPEIPCITFREKCMINGVYKRSNHSIKYHNWEDNADGFDYVRSPFYKDVIRTDIAKKVPFEHIRWNEDERFSYALKPWLTDEIHIDEELYYYIYNETNPIERYGLDRQ